MTIDKNSYGVVIGFGGCVLILAFIFFVQLFRQFRHVMPIAMQWVNAHGDELRALVWGLA